MATGKIDWRITIEIKTYNCPISICRRLLIDCSPVFFLWYIDDFCWLCPRLLFPPPHGPVKNESLERTSPSPVIVIIYKSSSRDGLSEIRHRVLNPKTINHHLTPITHPPSRETRISTYYIVNLIFFFHGFPLTLNILQFQTDKPIAVKFHNFIFERLMTMVSFWSSTWFMLNCNV